MGSLQQDLEVIQQIEKEAGIELDQLTAGNFNDEKLWDTFFELTGYLIEGERITAISLPGCKSINLSREKILDQLRYLGLYDCNINDISFLKRFSLLHTLSLRKNIIDDYSCLNTLPYLKTLSLRDNKISDLSFLEKVSSLQSLFLGYNKISDISSLKSLTGLHTLDLSSNQISNISSLKSLTSLKSLYLKKNPIGDISVVKYLSNLREFDVDKDKISIPPPGIMEKGIEAIRSYFSQVEKEGFDYLYEAKVLFVGEPGAGKTSLMKKLIDENYPVPNDNQKSTLGIDVYNGWQFPYTEDENITFSANFWDFGGQQVQYMIHHFFLTSRSFYILLADERRENTNYDYWFEIIDILGPNCPVLVVLNRRKDFSSISKFDVEEYRRRYPGKSIDLLKINLAEPGSGFNLLKNCIETTLSNLSHVGDKLPASWIPIRKEIEIISQTRNYIYVDEYKKLCRECGVTRENYQKNLCGYLNDLGIILHFGWDTNLSNIIFLNPEWLVQAVYTVLSDSELQKEQGIFTLEWLTKKWEEKYSAPERGYLLDLLLKDNFDLCYRLPAGGSPKYLVPQLLPNKRPSFEWDYSNNLKFRYRYKFMPKGLISRMIVRLNEYIDYQEDEGFVWEKGMILKRADNRALIMEDITKDGLKVINIFISGAAAGKFEFITLIREEINKIHTIFFKNISVDKMVPCICDTCGKISEPHFYKFDDLKNYVRKNKTAITCPVSVEDVSIKKMLEGVVEKRSERSANVDEMDELIRKMVHEEVDKKIIVPPIVIEDKRTTEKPKSKLKKTLEIIGAVLGIIVALIAIYEFIIKSGSTDAKDDKVEKEQAVMDTLKTNPDSTGNEIK